jgi:predicted dehydrogenase
MTTDVQLAVAGAGLIGRRHIDTIIITKGVKLGCIVDPAPEAKEIANTKNVPWFPSITHMFDHTGMQANIEGVILATPNQLHVENALECIAKNCPVLIEKPIASNVAEAEELVRAAKASNVPLLTGHHRRHNALIKKAKSLIDDNVLGNIVSVQGTCWVYKPDNYYDVEWRCKPGAGPVYINLIHDIDLMRHLCGDVESVQALESNISRNNDVEDTAVIILRFKNGALGTINVSDTIVSPWSWELTARENPAYPETDESCYIIGGSKASLSLPNLTLWQHKGERSWWNPISSTKIPFELNDPLVAQIKQFANVILGKEAPLVSGEEGLNTLRVIEAVKRSASSGEMVTLTD